MADIQKTIEIIFGARDQTGSVIGNLEQGLGNLENATEPFSQMQDLVLGTEAAIIGLTLALGALATWKAGEFHQNIAEVGTLFAANEEQVKFLSDGVKEFAATSTSDIETITQSMYDAISATGDWEGAVEFLGDAEQLAVAGATDLSSATDLLTTVLSAYGEETDQAQRYSDALFVTVQNGKTTIDELAGGIGRVASSAAAGNVDIETLGAAMAALTGATSNTNQSVTLLQSFLKELSNPGKDLAAVMGDLSLEVDGLPPILNALEEATGGSQEKMNALFGSTEAANGALILSVDAAGKFSGTLDAMADKAGAVSEAYDAMAKQFGNINQTLANNVTLSLIALGEDLLDGYGDAISSLTGVFGSLTQSIENGALKPLTDLFTRNAAEWSAILDGIAENLPAALEQVDLSGLVGAFDDLFDAVGDVFSAFFGDIDTTNVESLGDAIQKVVDTVEALTNITTGILRAWEPVIQKFGEWAQELIDSDEASEDLIGRVIGIGDVVNVLSGILGSATGVLSSLADVVILLAGASQLGKLGGSLVGIASAAGTVVGTLLGATALVGAILAVGTAAGYVLNELTGFGDAVNDIKLKNQDGTDSMRTFGDEVGEFLHRIGFIPDELYKAHTEMEKLAISLEETTFIAKKGGDAVEELGDKTGEAGKSFLELKAESDALKLSMVDVDGTARDLGFSIEFVEGYFKDAIGSGVALGDALRDLENAASQGEAGLNRIGASVEDIGLNFDKLGPDLDELLSSLSGDVDSSSIDKYSSSLEELGFFIRYATDAYGENSLQVQQLKAIYNEQSSAISGLGSSFEKAADGSTTLGANIGLVGNAAEKTTEKTKGLTDQLTEVQKEAIETERLLLELASNEVIASMEFSADIRVAEIEADAAKTVAAFESIASTIDSLTQQTTSLVDSFLSADSLSERFQIEDWVERSFDQQEAALEKQADLIDSQIKYLDARTDTLLSGEGLINIDGTGLDAQLEGLLVEIFRRIQIKASAEGAEFLLGGLGG